jgi:acyl-CoA synthetase (AMP-forming)/AMP-acid ligase II
MGQSDDMRVLADVSRTQARTQPQATAQIFRHRVTSYLELDQRASQVANGLIMLGCRPSTRIGYR